MTFESRPPLTLEQFEALLDTHGADLERWPAARRAAAGELLEREPTAAELLTRFRAFEAQLNELPRLQVSPDLKRSILEVPARHPRSSTGWSMFFSRWWVPVLAGTFAVLVGGFSGWSTYSDEADSVDDADWGDVSALALASDLDEGWE